MTGTTQVLLTASNTAGSTSETLILTVGLTPPAIPLRGWRWTTLGASVNDAAVSGNLADPDADGIPNLFEYVAGTDPLAGNAWPWSYAVQNDSFTLTVSKDPRATGGDSSVNTLPRS